MRGKPGLIIDAVSREDTPRGRMLVSAGGQHYSLEFIALLEINDVVVPNRILERVCQVRKPADWTIINLLNHEIPLFLVADVVIVRQHLGKDDERRTLLCRLLGRVVIEPKRCAPLPICSPCSTPTLMTCWA